MRNPTRVGVADILVGSIILDDEDRRAVAAYQRIQADYETQLIATGLTPTQRAIVERMRQHHRHLDFITCGHTDYQAQEPHAHHRPNSHAHPL